MLTFRLAALVILVTLSTLPIIFRYSPLLVVLYYVHDVPAEPRCLQIRGVVPLLLSSLRDHLIVHLSVLSKLDSDPVADVFLVH